MKNNTTSSSSTASNITPHKSQDSDEPLDGASCSASSIWEEIVKTRKEMKEEWDKWFVKYNALNDKLTQLEASLPKD
jgi:hypothetical protein